jgi:hypothetical protein
MAVVTTLMASPVFELVYGRHARRIGELGAIHETASAPQLNRISNDGPTP